MTFPIKIVDFKITFDDTEIIRHWEGHSLVAYPCQAGKMTISYGLTGPDIVKGLVITEEQSMNMFANRIEYFCHAIFPLIKKDISKTQFIALLSFTFNSGVTNFRNSTLLRKLNAGVISQVPEEIMKWKYYTDPKTGEKKISKGLVKRRLSERDMFRFGELRFDHSQKTIDSYMNV